MYTYNKLKIEVLEQSSAVLQFYLHQSGSFWTSPQILASRQRQQTQFEYSYEENTE